MNPASIKGLFSSSRISVSPTDLILLIDELKYPALLFDENNKKIQCGNIAFIELSGLGNAELVHLGVHDLFLELENYQFEGGKPTPAILVSKNKLKIPVSLSNKRISEFGNISLLSISRKLDTIQSNDFPINLLDEIQGIFRICITGDLPRVIQSVIEAAQNIFGFSPLSLYRLENNHLRRLNAERKFPVELPAVELDRLNNLDIWYPGKRVLCEVHRIGRKSGFSGLLSMPIQNEKFNGLFIMGIDSHEYFIAHEEQIATYFRWVNQLIGLTIEISNSRSEQNNLQNQNARLLTFVENAEDLMLILDEDNHIEYASRPFLQLMQYASYEVLNKNVFDFIDEQKMKVNLSDLRSIDNSEDRMIELHDREGRHHLMEYRIDVYHQEGTIKKVFRLSSRTRLIELTRSIERIERQASLGESIADFAHDVRNPLNNISTGLQMVRKIYRENEQLTDVVDRMQSDCIRMTDLIESVLSYSRQDIKNYDLVDLESLLKSVHERFKKKLEKSQIFSVFSMALDTANIIGDYRSLERVFINLLNNSIESMEQNGGELAIMIKSNPSNREEIEVSIADTGPGIPKEILENLFKPYISGKKTGTGLGLAITKRIVDAHQGRIEIESFPNGTIFRLFFTKHMEEIQ